MHDNVPSHVFNVTRDFDRKMLTGKTTEWPPSNLRLNPIENLWSFVKSKLQEDEHCMKANQTDGEHLKPQK